MNLQYFEILILWFHCHGQRADARIEKKNYGKYSWIENLIEFKEVLIEKNIYPSNTNNRSEKKKEKKLAHSWVIMIIIIT